MKQFNEKLIAVVGVSNNPGKYGFKIFKSLIDEGLNVVGVNTRGDNVLNKIIYRKLSEIGKVPDIVITVVMPEETEKIVEQCKALGVGEIWMQPGSESEKAIEMAKKYGIAVTHNSCIMVNNNIW